ncbi:unnamed protein product [Adineta steineri]|uniref:Uncharacterized protein n=1 Tax=Adineta steineri TaxID=433720 RepID=A0A819X207_9BILA|nr:unnamed protein product [Adineta steineri]
MSSVLIVLLHTFILCRSQIINFQCNFDTTPLTGDCQFISTTGGPAMTADTGPNAVATAPRQPLSDVKAISSPTVPNNEYCVLPYTYTEGGWAMHFCRRFTATNIACPTESGPGQCNAGSYGLIKPSSIGTLPIDVTYVANVQKSSNSEQCLDFYYYITDNTENAKIEIAWENDKKIEAITAIAAVPSENKWQHKQVTFMGPSLLSSYKLIVRAMRNTPQLNFAFAFDEIYIYDQSCGNVFDIDNELFYFIFVYFHRHTDDLTNATPEPITTDAPTTATTVPTTATDAPTTDTDAPATATDALTTATDASTTDTAAPTTDTTAPTTDTAAPTTDTAAPPPTDTAAPATDTVAPATDTAAPPPTDTAAPATDTVAPATDTAAPATVTDVPVTATAAPTTATAAPATATAAPTISTAAPTTTTAAPTTATDASTTATPAPTTATAASSTATNPISSDTPTVQTSYMETTTAKTIPSKASDTNPNLALILPLAIGIPVSLGIIGSIAYYFKVFKPKHKINVNSTTTADDIPMVSQNNTTNNNTTVDALQTTANVIVSSGEATFALKDAGIKRITMQKVYRICNDNTTQYKCHGRGKHTKRSASATETTLDQFWGAFWMGLITIGTPGQTFYSQLDTGSSDLWVPGQQCGAACGKRKNILLIIKC